MFRIFSLFFLIFFLYFLAYTGKTIAPITAEMKFLMCLHRSARIVGNSLSYVKQVAGVKNKFFSSKTFGLNNWGLLLELRALLDTGR